MDSHYSITVSFVCLLDASSCAHQACCCISGVNVSIVLRARTFHWKHKGADLYSLIFILLHFTLTAIRCDVDLIKTSHGKHVLACGDQVEVASLG